MAKHYYVIRGQKPVYGLGKTSLRISFGFPVRDVVARDVKRRKFQNLLTVPEGRPNTEYD